MDKLKKDILQEIKKSEVHKALDLMQNCLLPSSDAFQFSIAAEARYNFIGSSYIKGKLNFDEYALEINKLTHDILSIVLKLTPDEVIPTSFDAKPQLANIKELAVHDLIVKAKNCRKNKDNATAIVCLEEAYKRKPESLAIQNDLAISYRIAKQYDRALSLFDNIKDQRLHDVQSINEMAICQREMGRFNSSLETLNRGLLLYPTNNHFHTNKFFIYLFFNLNAEKAKETWYNYRHLTDKNLIFEEKLRENCLLFIENLELIKEGKAEENIMHTYLEECILSKNAYKTAKNIVENMNTLHLNYIWLDGLSKKLPPSVF